MIDTEDLSCAVYILATIGSKGTIHCYFLWKDSKKLKFLSTPCECKQNKHAAALREKFYYIVSDGDQGSFKRHKGG